MDSSFASSKSLFILAASRLVRKFDVSRQLKLLPSGAVRLENIELETSLLWSSELPGNLKFAWLGSLQVDLSLLADPSTNPTAVVISDCYVVVTDPEVDIAAAADERGTLVEEGADAVHALKLVLYGLLNRLYRVMATALPPSVQAFETNVLSLMEFELQNIHVRLEDSHAGLDSAVPFQYAAGMVAEAFAVRGADVQDSSGAINKVGELKGFAMYFCEDLMLHETEAVTEQTADLLSSMLEDIYSPPYALPLLVEKTSARFTVKLDPNVRNIDVDVQMDDVKLNATNEQLRYIKAFQTSFGRSNVQSWLAALFTDFVAQEFGGAPLLLPTAADVPAEETKTGGAEAEAGSEAPSTSQPPAPETKGILTVTVGEAVNLPASKAEIVSELNDALVMLQLGHSAAKHCTKVCPKTMNPLWAESFAFEVTDAALIQDPHIKLSCLDHNLVTDNVIGTAELDLSAVFAAKQLAVHKQVLPLAGEGCSTHPLEGTRLTVYVSYLADASNMPTGGALPIMHPDFALPQFTEAHVVHPVVPDSALVEVPDAKLTVAVRVPACRLSLLALPADVEEIEAEDYAGHTLLSLSAVDVSTTIVQHGATRSATCTVGSSAMTAAGADPRPMSSVPLTVATTATPGERRTFSVRTGDTMLSDVDVGVVAGALAQMVPAETSVTVSDSPLLAEMLNWAFSTLGHPNVVQRVVSSPASRPSPATNSAGLQMATGGDIFLKPGSPTESDPDTQAQLQAKLRQTVLLKRELNIEKRDFRNADVRKMFKLVADKAKENAAAAQEEMETMADTQNDMAAQLMQLQAEKKALQTALAEQTNKAFRLEEEVEQTSLQLDFLQQQYDSQREQLTEAKDGDQTHKAVVDVLELEAELMRKQLEASQNLLIRRMDPKIAVLTEEVLLLTAEKQELTKVHNELLENFGKVDESRAALLKERDELRSEKQLMRGWLYRFQQQMGTLKRLNPYVYSRLVAEPLVTEVGAEHKLTAKDRRKSPGPTAEDLPERDSWAMPGALPSS